MTSQGHPRLVNALAKMYSKIYSREIDPMSEVRTLAFEWKYYQYNYLMCYNV